MRIVLVCILTLPVTSDRPDPDLTRPFDPDPPRVATTHARGNGPRVVESAALFGGASELRVLHGGHEYRLRVTRQGRLLLTK